MKPIHKVLISLFLIAAVAVYVATSSPVRRINLPEGKLSWSNERPENAKLCVPAAFTDAEGKIVGEYILNGQIFGAGNRPVLKVSVCDDIFYIDSKWHSDFGFKQFSLVYNSKARRFSDTRRFVRRALCKKGDDVFLLQSWLPMTLTAFAEECAKVSTNAANLDMGSYGYGYTSVGKVKLPLLAWSVFGRKKQTNWLYVK